MSFWIVTYHQVDRCVASGPRSIHKTEDEAILAAITGYGCGELRRTSNGTVWYDPMDYKTMDKPIKLNKLIEKVSETGIFNCHNARDDNDWYTSMTRYCTIDELKLEQSPELEIKDIEYDHCDYCNCTISSEITSEFKHRICDDCLVHYSFCSFCNSEDEIQEGLAQLYSYQNLDQCSACEKWFCFNGDHLMSHKSECSAKEIKSIFHG
jgi:hypothetical protein